MTRTPWPLLSSCILFLLLALPAQARTLKIETIRTDPFGYEDARGKGGMMYEIGNLIAETAGLPHENRIVPYARTVLSLKDGSADMVLRFNNDELSSAAIQLMPVVSMQTVVLSLANRPVNSLTELDGKLLAVVRSFPLDPRIENNSAIRTYITDSNEHSMRMLLAGRVDAVLGSDVGMYGAASTLGYPANEFAAPIKLDSRDFWLHVSRKTADDATTIKALKNAVEKLQRQGAINRIRQRYLPSGAAPH